jgi:hypothetical protein
MMELRIKELVQDMRGWTERVRQIESAGGFTKSVEVGPDSFVQVLQWASVMPNQLEPVTWRYFQCWVNTMSPADQEKIIGAYVGEYVEQNKVVGIFDVALAR